jgi:hypothetical protein
MGLTPEPPGKPLLFGAAGVDGTEKSGPFLSGFVAVDGVPAGLVPEVTPPGEPGV